MRRNVEHSGFCRKVWEFTETGYASWNDSDSEAKIMDFKGSQFERDIWRSSASGTAPSALSVTHSASVTGKQPALLH